MKRKIEVLRGRMPALRPKTNVESLESGINHPAIELRREACGGDPDTQGVSTRPVGPVKRALQSPLTRRPFRFTLLHLSTGR